MSLKLGNTNIAGTQVLYSTTGNNTDGAMTQAITTTQLNLKANDADVVHKTGNESINGIKTFTSNVRVSKTAPYLDLYNTNITKGTVPSSLQAARNAMLDKDGKNIAMTQYQYNTTGEIQAVIRAYNPNNETDFAQISIWYPPTGNPYTYAPASDINYSIVTTISKSKATNGYFKLGNGLIIQWGNNSSTTVGRTISFPVAFSGTNYGVSIVAIHTTYDGDYVNIIKDKTSTGFKANTNKPISWVAIGY